jgi:hypothetical protein
MVSPWSAFYFPALCLMYEQRQAIISYSLFSNLIQLDLHIGDATQYFHLPKLFGY